MSLNLFPVTDLQPEL